MKQVSSKCLQQCGEQERYSPLLETGGVCVEVSQTTKSRATIEPVMPLLGVYPKDPKHPTDMLTYHYLQRYSQ